MTDSWPNDDRIQRSLDGLLSPEEYAALQENVIRDEALRTAYVEQMWLHSTLRTERDSLVSLFNQSPPLQMSAIETLPMRRWPVALWAAAAAACVTLLVTAWVFRHDAALPQPVATLVESDNCKWAGSDLPTAVHAQLGTGKLALVEGIATLKFTSGAIVTMEAPSTLEILTAMKCRLIEGTLTAEVPESAHGFTIDTPDIKVVDLGTRFGVTASSTGNSQVRVFEGEVEIDGLVDGHTKRLTEGKGLHVSSGTTTQGQEPTLGQPVKEEGGWTAIPTSFGRGKDGYARRGDHRAPLGAQPLIIVKHTNLPTGRNNERRAVITFDLSEVALSHIAEAQLVLDPEPSGFGFSSLVPDSRFAVYGLIDEALDAWDEQAMRWGSLPGCTDDGPDCAEYTQISRVLDSSRWLGRAAHGASRRLCRLHSYEDQRAGQLADRPRDGRDRHLGAGPRFRVERTS